MDLVVDFALRDRISVHPIVDGLRGTKLPSNKIFHVRDFDANRPLFYLLSLLMNKHSTMSFRKLISRRRNGVPSGFVEAVNLKTLGDNESSKYSRQATQDTEEFDWETLDDNTNIDWDEFCATIRKIPSLKGGTALKQLPLEFQSGCLLHDAIRCGAPDDILMYICEVSRSDFWALA